MTSHAENKIAECVVAVYAGLDRAEDAIRRLLENGIPVEQISLVTTEHRARISSPVPEAANGPMPHVTSLRDEPELVERRKLGDDSVHNAAVGASLGGTLGMLTGACVSVLSGLGAVFIAGPLAGGLFGTIAGALIGALSGTGIHDHLLTHYESLVAQGKALMIVNGDPVQLANAFRALRETERVELHLYAATGDETLEEEVA